MTFFKTTSFPRLAIGLSNEKTNRQIKRQTDSGPRAHFRKEGLSSGQGPVHREQMSFLSHEHLCPPAMVQDEQSVSGQGGLQALAGHSDGYRGRGWGAEQLAGWVAPILCPATLRNDKPGSGEHLKRAAGPPAGVSVPLLPFQGWVSPMAHTGMSHLTCHGSQRRPRARSQNQQLKPSVLPPLLSGPQTSTVCPGAAQPTGSGGLHSLLPDAPRRSFHCLAVPSLHGGTAVQAPPPPPPHAVQAPDGSPLLRGAPRGTFSGTRSSTCNCWKLPACAVPSPCREAYAQPLFVSSLVPGTGLRHGAQNCCQI